MQINLHDKAMTGNVTLGMIVQILRQFRKSHQEVIGKVVLRTEEKIYYFGWCLAHKCILCYLFVRYSASFAKSDKHFFRNDIWYQ